MTMQVQRPIIKQEGDALPFTVPVAPAAPLMPQAALTSLIDVFMITIPSTAANSVWLGFNQGVIVGNGIELLAGTTVVFRIDHDTRQLYEVQSLLIRINNALCGQTITPADAIPFVVWDMANVFVVASAATNISFAVFKAVYI